MIFDPDAAPVTVAKGEGVPGRLVVKGIAAVGDDVAGAALHEELLEDLAH
jgi:hypothetical protein